MRNVSHQVSLNSYIIPKPVTSAGHHSRNPDHLLKEKLPPRRAQLMREGFAKGKGWLEHHGNHCRAEQGARPPPSHCLPHEYWSRSHRAAAAATQCRRLRSWDVPSDKAFRHKGVHGCEQASPSGAPVPQPEHVAPGSGWSFIETGVLPALKPLGTGSKSSGTMI